MRSPVIPIMTILASQFCQTPQDAVRTESGIYEIITTGQAYLYDTGVAGDKEGARTLEQPQHYLIGSMDRNAAAGERAVYIYRPWPDYRGNDQAILTIDTGSDGAPPPTKSRQITIRFTIE